jgi:hypothetical protein
MGAARTYLGQPIEQYIAHVGLERRADRASAVHTCTTILAKLIFLKNTSKTFNSL